MTIFLKNLGSMLLHFLCLFLGAVLLWAAWYSFNSYWRWQGLQSDLQRIEARHKILRQQVPEINRKIKTAQRVERFLKRTADMQLRPEDWNSFDVNVQGWISFLELEQIISQCAASEQVYFAPISFAVQTSEAAMENDQTGTVAPAVNKEKDASSVGSDVHLILSGAFKIRR